MNIYQFSISLSLPHVEQNIICQSDVKYLMSSIWWGGNGQLTSSDRVWKGTRGQGLHQSRLCLCHRGKRYSQIRKSVWADFTIFPCPVLFSGCLVQGVLARDIGCGILSGAEPEPEPHPQPRQFERGCFYCYGYGLLIR